MLITLVMTTKQIAMVKLSLKTMATARHQTKDTFEKMTYANAHRTAESPGGQSES